MTEENEANEVLQDDQADIESEVEEQVEETDEVVEEATAEPSLGPEEVTDFDLNPEDDEEEAVSIEDFDHEAEEEPEASSSETDDEEDASTSSEAAEQSAEAEESHEEPETETSEEEPEAETSEEETEVETSEEEAEAETSEEETEAEEASGAETEEAAEEEQTDGKKKMTAGRKALIIIAAALVAIFAGCCVALAVDDSIRTQYVPQNTMLDGRVDISGMTKDELSDLIATRVENQTGTKVTLIAGDKHYEFDMSEVGDVDTDGIIAQAYAPYGNNIIARFGSRIYELFGGEMGSHEVSLRYATDPEKLDAKMEVIIDDANTDPKNAGYEFDGGSHSLKVSPAAPGLEVDAEETTNTVKNAIEDVASGDMNRLNLKATVEVTEPESTEPGQAIFVDTVNCRTRLYEDGKEVASYPNSPGTSGYPTPKGDFYLDYKDPAPVWINPHSDWSANMEEEIAPGPSNPLGVRALAVSCGGGIFLHGTTSVGGLGAPASHGCVRHSNNDIVELYDRVSAGIPIIIR